MTCWYLDLTGKRDWGAAFGAIDILAPTARAVFGGVVYVHLTDLQNAANGTLVPSNPLNRAALRDLMKTLGEQNRFGDESTTVVVVSGKTVIVDPDRQQVSSLLSKQCKPLRFVPNVARSLNGEQLRRAVEMTVEEVDITATFRLLWQAFVLATCREDAVPERMKALRSRFRDLGFPEGYWQPVLQGNQLHVSLVERPPGREAAAISALAKTTDWSRLPDLSVVVDEYARQWFGC